MAEKYWRRLLTVSWKGDTVCRRLLRRKFRPRDKAPGCRLCAVGVLSGIRLLGFWSCRPFRQR